MLFSFTAVRKDGTHYDGTMDVVDKFALYKELHGKGDTVLTVRLGGGKRTFWQKLNEMNFGGVKADERISFAKNLSAMIKAGLPLSRALVVLDHQMNKKQWKEIFVSIQESLAKGSTFSQSLEEFPKVFPPFLTSMVAVGEQSGSLVSSLSIVAEQLEKTRTLQKKVRGAMIYPCIVLSVMAVIGVLMFVFVVPQLASTFTSFNAALPLPTLIILGASGFFSAYWMVLLIGFVAAVVAFYTFSKTLFGKKVIHRIIITLPVTGSIAVEINTARTARTLSSTLASGVDVVAALRITSDVVQNIHYKLMLQKAAEDIQKGASLQSIFTPYEDIYPTFITEMIGVGEETGTLSKTLFEVAEFYENEVDEKTKDMSTIVEPLMMVVIGLGVGFFALAIISPIYSLSNAIS